MKRIALISSLILIVLTETFGQCGPGTPVYFVDLSNDPSASWVSPSIVRNDTCCGGTDNCVQFLVTLHPDAEGLSFEVFDGALAGILTYEVDCSGPISIDSATCISGPGPHSLTFCKPGSNANKYRLNSIPKPSLGVDITIAEGCVDTLKAEGFTNASTFWRSIYPGAIGDYDSYLDCTIGCEMAIVTPEIGYPEYIDYQICGFASSMCDTVGICDTVRVYFADSLKVKIMPEMPMVCYGDMTTPISATISGGEAPYSYFWSTGETSQTIDVGPGTYSVIINDAGNCYSVNASVTVGEFYDFISADAGEDQLLCNQGPEVQLNGSITGISTAYWKGGNGTFIPDSAQLNAVYIPTGAELSAGFVDLSLLTTNTQNCEPDSDMVHIDFDGFNGSVVSIIDSISCFGSNDALIILSVNGDYSNYSYLWDDPYSSVSSSIVNLSPAEYTVIITDSLSCDTSLSFVITEPELLTIDSVFQQDLLCFNDSSGEAGVYMQGGTSPYYFEWDINTGNQETYIASDLSAGMYTVNIHDNNGCTEDTVFIINEPTQLNLELEDLNDVLCFGEESGSASVIASGGTPDYSYEWDINGTAVFNTGISNLFAGTYTVFVNDENACIDSLTVIIDEPTELTSETTVLENVSCFGGDNGSGEVSVAGGIGPYTYLWDSLASFQTTALATGLSNGIYTVEVTDSNSCSIITQIEITEPEAALSIELDLNDVSCFGLDNASVSISATGGTAPYSYVWDQSLSNNDSSMVDSIAPGTYLVWINDANNCIASEMFTITEPNPIIIETTKTDVTCFGGNNGDATIQVIGGTGPFQYAWGDEADNQTTAMASNLSAGEYDFTIEDQNECIDSGIVVIVEPTEVLIEASEDQILCPNTDLTMSAQGSGGVGPYNYFWLDLGQGQEQMITVTEDVSYQVVVIDSLGCPSEYDSVNISVIEFNASDLVLSNSTDICFGETTTLFAEFAGEMENYDYEWSYGLGASLDGIEVSPEETTTYIFTVSDECGATLSDSTTVSVQYAPQVSIEATVNEGCVPLEVQYSAQADQENLSYVWTLGNMNVSTAANPTAVYDEAGEFIVSLNVFSEHNCSADPIEALVINAYPIPTSDFIASPWETDISEALIEFTNTSSEEAVFFTWSFDDGGASMDENPNHEYLNAGEYFVSLETESVHGCISSIEKKVLINPNHDVDIPTGFTPNSQASSDGYYNPNDLSNDIFYPFAEFVIEFNMQIFNRWGELIFESNDIAKGWDGYYKGILSPAGGYVYKIDLTFYDGYRVETDGQVKLIR